MEKGYLPIKIYEKVVYLHPTENFSISIELKPHHYKHTTTHNHGYLPSYTTDNDTTTYGVPLMTEKEAMAVCDRWQEEYKKNGYITQE